MIWLVADQAAGLLKSVLISSPTHQFVLMRSDVSYRYSTSLLEFPSLKNTLSLSCGFDLDAAASHCVLSFYHLPRCGVQFKTALEEHLHFSMLAPLNL